MQGQTADATDGGISLGEKGGLDVASQTIQKVIGAGDARVGVLKLCEQDVVGGANGLELDVGVMQGASDGEVLLARGGDEGVQAGFHARDVVLQEGLLEGLGGVGVGVGRGEGRGNRGWERSGNWGERGVGDGERGGDGWGGGGGCKGVRATGEGGGGGARTRGWRGRVVLLRVKMEVLVLGLGLVLVLVWMGCGWWWRLVV